MAIFEAKCLLRTRGSLTGGQLTTSRGILSIHCRRFVFVWVSCLATLSVTSKKSSEPLLARAPSVATGRRYPMRYAMTVGA